MTSKEIRQRDPVARTSWSSMEGIGEQIYELTLQVREIAARMAEQAESTPAPEAPEGWYAPTRCQICGWPLSGSLEKGCVQASCSMRPGEHTEEYRRIQRRMNWIAAQPDMPLCFAYLSRKHQLAPEAASAATPSDAVTRDKERKEQIAEVETEIDLLCKVWPAYYPSDSATMERIVDVEKARLAELKRGLREVPRG